MTETTCQRCGLPVILLDTIKRKPITLDPTPSGRGNIIINEDTALVYRNVASIHPSKLGEPRYLLHECKEG
jgi:hypothetical protein